MTDEKMGTLFGAFANYYWSVPVSFVRNKISEWHPEVTVQQIRRVLKRCTEHPFWNACIVMTDGVKEPELVAEHLYALGGDNLDQFIATRVHLPYHDCDEETLLKFENNQFDLPEADAIMDFGKTELSLDDEWAKQLVSDCVFFQPSALCDGSSWVRSVLTLEKYGKIYFKTIEQVKRFRTLGNDLYQAMPNPVLKGWRPSEVRNAPILPDDIPERDEDIPDGRPAIDQFWEPYGGREVAREMIMKRLIEKSPRKIGRNERCPCGSGKKYKKCCGK